MRLRAAHIVLLLTALALLAGCGRKGKVIPEKKMMDLYADMYLADQWVRDHPPLREVVDTTLLFDPIFRRHGYSFADYDRSVHYYLDRPEKYAKLLSRASERMRKEATKLGEEAERQKERREEIEHMLRLYRRQDFTTDSLRWSGPQTLWPEFVDDRAPGAMLLLRQNNHK